MRPVASDTFSESPYYQRQKFHRGLNLCGFDANRPPKERPNPEDILLIWNRSSRNEAHARRYEQCGARVIVCENGYIGADNVGGRLYAMALGHHLGAGSWKEGEEDRWTPLGLPVAPWRENGGEIVVLPQRGFGEAGIAMPHYWTSTVVGYLKSVTRRPIRVRQHPGSKKTDPVPDLKNAWAAVTWASGAGIKALVGGTPVFYDMPRWIGGAAGVPLEGANLEQPFLGDRLPMLRRLAWSQWSIAEIANGTAFKWLLQPSTTSPDTNARP